MPRSLSSLVDHPMCQDCALHREEGAGCAVVEPGSTTPLDGFLAREPCVLKDHLRRFASRYLAHRPRSLLDPDDLTQEVSSRLLADDSLRRGGFGRGLAAFLGYLRQAAVRCAISAERSQRGRIRCGNCRHFAPYSGICLKERHAWTHRDVAASQDPRRLDPACGQFVARRDAVGAGADPIHAQAPTEDHAAVEEAEFVAAVDAALVRLAELQPRAALVVRARLLEGRSYDDLTDVPASLRTMKRDYAFGMAFLRRRLSAFEPENVAQTEESVRSRRMENADS